jgi:hypothetical protein
MATIPLPRDFSEFLKLLEDEKVEYLIDLGDLKINKRASARHKDLDDLEHLP